MKSQFTNQFSQEIGLKMQILCSVLWISDVPRFIFRCEYDLIDVRCETENTYFLKCVYLA